MNQQPPAAQQPPQGANPGQPGGQFPPPPVHPVPPAGVQPPGQPPPPAGPQPVPQQPVPPQGGQQIPAPPPVIRTYLDYYQMTGNDPYAGNYADVEGDYLAPTQGNSRYNPQTLAERVAAASAHDQPHAMIRHCRAAAGEDGVIPFSVMEVLEALPSSFGMGGHFTSTSKVSPVHLHVILIATTHQN